tara:strand:- start:40 stop:432 length:393 start_codon:yes stop_codon:yes gene_type:complete
MSSLGQLNRSVSFEVVDSHGEGQENVPFVMLTPKDQKVVGFGFSEKDGVGNASVASTIRVPEEVILTAGSVAGEKISTTPESIEAKPGSSTVHRFTMRSRKKITPELLIIGSVAFVAGLLINEIKDFKLE